MRAASLHWTPEEEIEGRLICDCPPSTEQEPCLCHPLSQPLPWKGELPFSNLTPAVLSSAPPLPWDPLLSALFLTPALLGCVSGSQFPGLFDVGHVAEQLRQAGILEIIGTRSAHFPVRVPFQVFLAR